VILAGDVGATKILLEVGEARSGRWEPAFSRRYETRNEVSFADALHEFFDDWKREGGGGSDVSAAAFGVAGPVDGNKVKMTHRPWVVDGDFVTNRFAIPKVRVANDLAAAAHGIDWIPAEDILEIQPGTVDPREPRVVLGVGTGLGISYRVNVEGTLREVSGEGGHANFGPGTLDHAALWQTVFREHGRCSAEDLLSGRGLQHIYGHVTGRGAHVPGATEFPESHEISAGADRGEPMCKAALALFADVLGSVAGDHAVSLMARGGVFLVGGVVTKLSHHLATDRFRQSFCAKGMHSALMMRIPVRAVRSERIAVIGAARMASEL
jgi:glucokinase